MENHHGYVAERIITMQKQDCWFEGVLSLEDVDPCLRAPLALCEAEVVQIRPCTTQWEKRLICGSEEIELLLLCSVMDACGRRGRAIARIRLQIDASDYPGNVRRGAEIVIRSTCSCGIHAFQVQASICVQTVISRHEVLCAHRPCPPACPALPLYPPAPKHRVKRIKCTC